MWRRSSARSVYWWIGAAGPPCAARSDSLGGTLGSRHPARGRMSAGTDGGCSSAGLAGLPSGIFDGVVFASPSGAVHGSSASPGIQAPTRRWNHPTLFRPLSRRSRPQPLRGRPRPLSLPSAPSAIASPPRQPFSTRAGLSVWRASARRCVQRAAHGSSPACLRWRVRHLVVLQHGPAGAAGIATCRDRCASAESLSAPGALARTGGARGERHRDRAAPALLVPSSVRAVILSLPLGEPGCSRIRVPSRRLRGPHRTTPLPPPARISAHSRAHRGVVYTQSQRLKQAAAPIITAPARLGSPPSAMPCGHAA